MAIALSLLGESTYYNFPADNSTSFAFTIATTPALCGLACIDFLTLSL